MSRLARTHASLFVVLLLVGVCGAPRRLAAQTATGEFLCSVPTGGQFDGAPCNGDEDCPGGVCVVAQGVCDAPGADDDGFPCDCGGGTCVGDTCRGGTAAGLACDTTTNCSGSRPCTGTQKVCLGGSFKGFSCLRNDQCPGSSCRSTGKFCIAGTDFESFSCVSDTDCCSNAASCPAGACEGLEATPTATRTATRTAATGTPKPTSTPTATAATSTPSTGTPKPTATPTASAITPPVRTTTPTTTPVPGSGVGVVAQLATVKSLSLELVDASGFPTLGIVVQIGDEPAMIRYSRCSTCNTLRLKSPLASDVPAGTVVRILAFTPTPGPVGQVFEIVGKGGGCTVASGNGSGPLVLLLLGGALLAGAGGRRVRKNASVSAARACHRR